MTAAAWKIYHAHLRASHALLMGSIVSPEPEEHLQRPAIPRRAMEDVLETGTVLDVQRFIEDNGILCRDQEGYIPLHYACIFGRLDIVKDFLDQNEAVTTQMLSIRDSIGKTHLFLAVEYGQLEVVKELMKYGADVNSFIQVPNEENSQELVKLGPLDTAAYRSDWDIVEFLLHHGAISFEGNSFLHYAAAFGNIDQVQKAVTKNPEALHLKNIYGEIPLLIAVHNGHLQIVQYMVENGSNVNESSNIALPSLFIALDQGNQAVAKYLLKKGFNIKTPFHWRTPRVTPLHYYNKITPMNHHNWKIFTLLVEYGMKAEEKTRTLGGLLLAGWTFNTTILDSYLHLTESEVLGHLIPSILAAFPDKENPMKALLQYLLPVQISNFPCVQNSIEQLIKIILRMNPNAIHMAVGERNITTEDLGQNS